MADDILQNTLSGIATPPTTPAPATPSALIAPTTSVNPTGKTLSKDINTLQGAQKSPEMLLNLQKALTTSSQLAYRERQKSELETTSQQFDPTKVSGGTFASILGNLEQNRGTDVSRIYAATLSTYANVQEQITNRLQFLQGLKQAEDHFKKELSFKKSQVKADKALSKKQYQLEMKKINQAQSQWEAEFALAKKKAETTLTTNDVYPETGNYKALFTPSAQPQASFDPNSYLGINK